MYGLVNKAVQGLITAQFGAETWNQVARKANLPRCPFLSLSCYPDHLTYDLVAAASDVLALPADQVLQAFGEHWILFTAQEGYGSLLEHCGETLREFLLNVDTLHTRVRLIFPELHPPEFKVFELADGTIRFEYYSTRTGLAPMTLGLLNGLIKRFECPEARIEPLEPCPQGRYQEAFLIHLRG